MALLRLTLALVVLCAACSDSHPTSPTRSTAASPRVDPTAQLPFPAVLGAARLYVSAEQPPSEAHSRMRSRYVLYDNGTFTLQYATSPILEYGGRYTESNGEVVFDWNGWSKAGPWGATAKITEESLTVRYNVIMQLTDFEDGVYLRVR